MREELTERMFHVRDDLRPSNSRLMQMDVSKQMPSNQYFPTVWNSHARTLYLQALRDAATIARMPMRSSTPRAKKQKTAEAPSRMGLFCGLALKPGAPDSPV